MLHIGVQTKNIVQDADPADGFRLLRETGFSAADFSLNGYLLNTNIYRSEINDFFNASVGDLEHFFQPHRDAAQAAGIRIHQMHMPYPAYVPQASAAVNTYLWQEMAPKSLQVCAFLGCRYLVMHGFKLARFLGAEEEEWKQTEAFIDSLAPLARELGITLCIENLYDGQAGHMIEGPCCDARKAAERIDRINERYKAEVLGFCFDTGHANLVGLDFEGFLSTLGHWLKVLHIHDNDGVADLHQIPFTFTRTRENVSSTDWEGFIRGLQNIHFDGVLNFETAPVLSSFPDVMHRDALHFIAEIGTYFCRRIMENNEEG